MPCLTQTCSTVLGSSTEVTDTQGSECTFVIHSDDVSLCKHHSHTSTSPYELSEKRHLWWRFFSIPLARCLTLKRTLESSQANDRAQLRCSYTLRVKRVWAPHSESSHVDVIRQTEEEQQGWIWILQVKLYSCAEGRVS